MTDREVMQMALEALKKATKHLPVHFDSHFEAIAALHAALEQQAEPVAWMDREGDLYSMPVIENWAPPHTLLYAAPPQRKPLTDGEIEDIWVATDVPILGATYIKLVRQIEAAHGIKETP